MGDRTQQTETRSIFDTQQACKRCERKRWSDPLDTQRIIGDAIDTQGVGHAINIGYSTNWRRYQLLILNKLEMRSTFDTQQTETRTIPLTLVQMLAI